MSSILARGFAPWLLPASSLQSGVRGYCRSYFAKKTAHPTPGHLQYRQQFFRHSMIHPRFTKPDLKNPSEIKRIRKLGWGFRMSYNSGRNMIMRKIMKGERYLAEF